MCVSYTMGEALAMQNVVVLYHTRDTISYDQVQGFVNKICVLHRYEYRVLASAGGQMSG